eukprot:UC1_evm1s1024
MLAQKKGSSEAESRALGNIGRVYANQGLFDKALEAWLKKVPLVSDALESSWLFHEIGRCHYAKAEYLPAKEMGEKSKTHAIEADDAGWQLNSLILVGQAQAELGDLNEAVESFEAAKKLAKITSDGGAVTKLNRSISETKERMVDREPPAV